VNDGAEQHGDEQSGHGVSPPANAGTPAARVKDVSFSPETA